MAIGGWRGSRFFAWAILLGCAFVVFIGPWRIEWIEALDGSRATVVERPFSPTPSAAAKTEAGPLQVGFGSVSIAEAAAKHRVPLAGYIGRAGKPNDGIKDDVAVQAVVLDDGRRRIALVTGDLLLITSRTAAAIGDAVERRSKRLTRAHLYFGATHTHSGPGGFAASLAESFGTGRPNAPFSQELVTAFADAVSRAEANLEPAEWTSFAVEAPAECIANRTRDGGPTNRWVDVLGFRKPGETRWTASLVSFAAHATCDPPKEGGNRLCSDYPGAFRKALEERLGGRMAFLAGAVGSMGPGRLNVERTGLAAELGTRLSKAVVDASGSQRWNRDIRIDIAQVSLSLPAPTAKVYGGWCLSPILGAALLPTRTTITAARIGDTIYLGVPADFGGELALNLRGRIPGVRTVATSFAGDYVGYVIADRDYWLDRYEPRSMVLYGGRMEALFEDVLTKIAKGM